MGKLNLSDHPWLVMLSLLPVLLLILRRCQRMDLSPVLPLIGVAGGFWLELKRSGGDLPRLQLPGGG